MTFHGSVATIRLGCNCYNWLLVTFICYLISTSRSCWTGRWCGVQFSGIYTRSVSFAVGSWWSNNYAPWTGRHCHQNEKQKQATALTGSVHPVLIILWDSTCCFILRPNLDLPNIPTGIMMAILSEKQWWVFKDKKTTRIWFKWHECVKWSKSMIHTEVCYGGRMMSFCGKWKMITTHNNHFVKAPIQ